MNSAMKTRLDRIDAQLRFLVWLELERFLEAFSEEQLDYYIENGRLPSPLPARLPPGKSRYDQLDRKSLIREFQDHDREFNGRTPEELVFFTERKHWPEQACREHECRCNKV